LAIYHLERHILKLNELRYKCQQCAAGFLSRASQSRQQEGCRRRRYCAHRQPDFQGTKSNDSHSFIHLYKRQFVSSLHTMSRSSTPCHRPRSVLNLKTTRSLTHYPNLALVSTPITRLTATSNQTTTSNSIPLIPPSSRHKSMKLNLLASTPTTPQTPPPLRRRWQRNGGGNLPYPRPSDPELLARSAAKQFPPTPEVSPVRSEVSITRVR
jgi:hypothetical protein